MGDLARMRSDQAEALVELHEFVGHAASSARKAKASRAEEDKFWNL